MWLAAKQTYSQYVFVFRLTFFFIIIVLFLGVLFALSSTDSAQIWNYGHYKSPFVGKISIICYLLKYFVLLMWQHSRVFINSSWWVFFLSFCDCEFYTAEKFMKIFWTLFWKNKIVLLCFSWYWQGHSKRKIEKLE